MIAPVSKENPRSVGETAELRRLAIEEMGEPPRGEFTCDNCGAKYHCEYVFDWYNIDGDCIAEK